MNRDASSTFRVSGLVVLLVLASWVMSACGTDRPPISSLGAADELMAQARAAEAAGDSKSAIKLILHCLETCPSVARMVGKELRRMVDEHPELEPEVWTTVGRIERSVRDAKTPDDRVLDDLTGLESVYSAWGKNDRPAELLQQVSEHAPAAVHKLVVVTLATFMPGAFRQLSDAQVEFIVEEVAHAAERDQQMLQTGLFSAEEAPVLEENRIEQAILLAATLEKAGRSDDAARAVRRAVADAPRGCVLVGRKAKSLSALGDVKALCEVCDELDECRHAVSDDRGE